MSEVVVKVICKEQVVGGLISDEACSGLAIKYEL